VVESIRQAPERQRYVRGLRSWVGFSQQEVEIERPPRKVGVSKYGLLRLTKLALDGVFAFSNIPLRLSALMGALSIGAVLAFVTYAVYIKLVKDQSPDGFTALLAVMVFLAGVQLLSLGVIGEYIARIYEEVKGRPHYVVREVIGG
jgi:dolichol-phosphate mannosyltransferase